MRNAKNAELESEALFATFNVVVVGAGDAQHTGVAGGARPVVPEADGPNADGQ